MATMRIAVIAAGLCALSPLVHYYSVEARNYSLVQFETLVILYAAWAAVTEPDRVRWWALLVLAHAVQLWTHNYSLFLLPVLPLVCLVAGGSHRCRLAAKALSASGLAFALYIPWFLIARQHAALGIADWIVPFWLKIPPMAAIPRSLEVFGFGGLYPSNLSYLGTATPLRLVSLPLTAVLLTAAGLCRWSPTSSQADGRPAKALLLAFVALPLVGAWVSSLLFEPLYMVGRYDTIVLPVFLIVFAVGIDCVYRWRPIAGSAALALTAALGIQTHWTSLSGPVPDDMGRIAAYNLASEAAVSDPIIATGYRRLVVAYYLDRLDHRMEIRSYPPEVGEHPGWYSAARLLSDRTRLAREAQQLSESVQRDAAGRRLWLLISPRNDIDTYLDDALMGPFSIDEERTHRECGLICLTLPTLAESSE